MSDRSRIYTKNLLVRVTERDLELLDEARGSSDRSSYIRALIRRQPALEKPARVVDGQVVHRHKRETLIRTDYKMGSAVKVYSCECGEEIS